MTFEGDKYLPISGTGVGDELHHQNNAVYAAMIESVDESLGKIFQTLEKLGIAEDTIIAFTADNGGLSNRGAVNGQVSGRPLATSNLPLRTGKGWLYEGGIREAFIVKWPGVTKPGFVNETDVVVGSDLYPTFLEMANLPFEPQNHVDGASIVPSLRGRNLSVESRCSGIRQRAGHIARVIRIVVPCEWVTINCWSGTMPTMSSCMTCRRILANR